MIRPATEHDLTGIKKLMQSEPGFWQDSWRENILADALDSAGSLAFVWGAGGRILGFVCAHDVVFRGYLSSLIVAPAVRRQGIGRQLVHRVEKELRSRGCTVLISDVWRGAEAFYRSIGWSEPEVKLLRKNLAAKPAPQETRLRSGVMQPALRTRRLFLRPFELSDGEDLRRLAGDRAIADTTLQIPHPYEVGMAEEWILTQQPRFEAGEQVVFAVVLRESDQLIGAMGLVIEGKFRRAELGYWIGRPYWRNGYCTEAAQAVLEYGFRSLNLNRIHAYHFKRNPASGRVMQKLGMKHEGSAPQHVMKWGLFEDVELYGILRSGWRSPKGNP
jgi:RimJ/RimL family protein N-acetyltransferase/predicted N-acetyltransferase YhbS